MRGELKIIIDCRKSTIFGREYLEKILGCIRYELKSLAEHVQNIVNAINVKKTRITVGIWSTSPQQCLGWSKVLTVG